MISVKNDDLSRFDKRKIQQDQQPDTARPAPVVGEPAAKALGHWMDGRFVFSSPEAEAAWHRHAYRQAVHHEDWHHGESVEPQTLALIETGAGGKTAPHFYGPDGQARFANFRTIEPAEVRAIRARNFAGKTMEEISAAKMPGEDEAVHHIGGKGRSRSAARSPLIKHAPRMASAPQTSNQPNPVLVADSSAAPLMPEGLGTAPAAPRPMGGLEPWNVGGRIPSGNVPDVPPRPANDNIKPSTELSGPRVPGPSSPLTQTMPPDSTASPLMSVDSPVNNRKNDVDGAVQASIGERHERWAEDIMSKPESKDPAFVADQANQLITFNLPYAIDSFRNQPGRDIYQAPTPLDIELLRGAYTQKIVDLFPEQSRPELQKALDARPKILTSGPAGLSDLLEAVRQGEITGFSVDGQAVTMGPPNPYGAGGGPAIKKFNEIVGEEATNLVKGCEGVEGEVKQRAGRGSGKPESWIQYVEKRSTNLGSRRIDVTVSFEINGQPCSFQINTADTAVRDLFAQHEWEAIQSAAKIMRDNGANYSELVEVFTQRLKDKVISQFNAFFMIGKPKKGERSEEQMRKLARDTLGLLSCSEIELACKGNLVINKHPGL